MKVVSRALSAHPLLPCGEAAREACRSGSCSCSCDMSVFPRGTDSAHCGARPLRRGEEPAVRAVTAVPCGSSVDPLSSGCTFYGTGTSPDSSTPGPYHGDPAPRPAPRAARPLLARMLDSCAELLWPTRCVGCDLPGELLCDRCRERLPWIEQRLACPCCGAPFGRLACTQCERDWPVRSCVCALSFVDAAARMVTCLKDSHELRLAPVMAAAIACGLDEASAWDAPDGRPRYLVGETDALVFAPATSEAYARRGFDHMELVARELAPLMGLPLADVLMRSEARDQRVLGRAARRTNLEGTVTVAGDVSGLDLLLVDDVVTTGSTLNACTQALLERGAASVTACALARVW